MHPPIFVMNQVDINCYSSQLIELHVQLTAQNFLHVQECNQGQLIQVYVIDFWMLNRNLRPGRVIMVLQVGFLIMLNHCKIQHIDLTQVNINYYNMLLHIQS
eukprot:TRINITY_DN2726_c0_g1_i6.p19 TRINITY_DN2726_c0_g1~~TRINITY_DN2726_c0_g1_i6.p19  ORF type:complete len:102 (-),score=2.98 TRINITY_DN2726_c0_g1_i6:2367-2672(-)